MTESQASLCSAYLEQLRAELPAVRLISKRHDRLSRVIAALLKLITFGGQAGYMDRYVTTIGSRIYVPVDWEARSDAQRYIVLRHEAVHLRQFRRLTAVGMAFVYLVPILPLGLAWGRARLEWEAYQETLRATAEVQGLAAAKRASLHDHIVRQFVGPAYGWMWPFPRQVRRWIARAVVQLEREADKRSKTGAS